MRPLLILPAVTGAISLAVVIVAMRYLAESVRGVTAEVERSSPLVDDLRALSGDITELNRRRAEHSMARR